MNDKTLACCVRGLCAFAGTGLAAIAANAVPADTPPAAQPELSSRQIPILSADGLRFRDLNRNGQLDPYEDWRLAPEARAADLVSRMSLAEKAGTMLHGGEVKASDDLYQRIRVWVLDKHITAAVTRVDTGPLEEIARMHNTIQEIAEQGRLGIPMTISTDPQNHLGGPSDHIDERKYTLWPQPPGFSAIGDAGLVRRFAEIARREHRAVGIHMALSPMADLGTEPRWPRNVGTFGEDATVAREMVRAYVEGFQGSSDGLTRDGVISIVKHWAGAGAPAEKGYDAHYAHGKWAGFPGGDFDEHLSAFTGAFDVKVAGVMSTYTILRDLVHEGHAMEQVGGAFNKYLLIDLLRNRYGFTGMILSDWGVTVDQSLRGTPWGMEGATPLERFVKAIRAGVDQIGGDDAPQYLIEAVERGLLSEAQFDAAVRRIVVDKFRIGLFENPYVSLAEAAAAQGDLDAHALALDTQRRSMVLLKNENGLLPLRVAGADSPARVYLVNVKPEPLAARGLHVVTAPEEADFVLARLKSPPARASELSDGNLALKPGQPDFDRVVSLAASGLPVVVSVYFGRPTILTSLVPHVRGLFGDFGISDEAFLDVVLGKAQPEGSLPIELPRSMEAVEAQLPDLPYDSADPLFPYGFGLRY